MADNRKILVPAAGIILVVAFIIFIVVRGTGESPTEKAHDATASADVPPPETPAAQATSEPSPPPVTPAIRPNEGDDDSSPPPPGNSGGTHGSAIARPPITPRPPPPPPVPPTSPLPNAPKTPAPDAGAEQAAPAAATPAGSGLPAPVVVKKEPTRPDWLTEEEQRFLDTTGGLRPVAIYESSKGLVSIKLKKAGLAPDQIFYIAIGPKYDYYKRTDLVETSFRGVLDGINMLFTGTVVKKAGLRLAFVPVVTTFTRVQNAGHILIEWSKPDDATAKRFLEANTSKLEEAMRGAGVGKSLEDYEADIYKVMSDTKTIWGRHDYYPEMGYYLYQQKAIMEGWIQNAIANVAGVGDIKGAALKIGYQVLQEPNMAGKPGDKGPKVEDMSGATLRAGP